MSPNRGAPTTGPVDYQVINSSGWDMLSLLDDPAPIDASAARDELDGYGWIPWGDISTVLFLASGGGEQGPRFAALGYEVTVVDLSEGQLERDRQQALEMELTIECVQADMCDLAPLAGRTFDLVYQAISTCYIPDVTKLYEEVAGVTRPGGLYMAQHWSPAHLQVASENPWDGAAYRVDRPAAASDPLLWESDVTWSGDRATCLHYAHTLDTLIGGLGDAGFDIAGFRQPDVGNPDAEPGSDDHVAAYFPSFLWLLGRRRAS
jgi:SAM-dependent methyltransferase